MVERTNVTMQEHTPYDSPDRTARSIREDIAAKRESISETVDKLGERIHQTFDWHEYVVEHPGLALGLAAGAGFVIAGIFKRRPTPQQRIIDAVADLTEDMTDRIGDVMSGVIEKKLVSGPTLKAGAAAIIARIAIDIVKNKVSAAMSGDASRTLPTPQGEFRSNIDLNVQPVRSSTTAGSRA